jgi:hypothetical protein
MAEATMMHICPNHPSISAYRGKGTWIPLGGAKAWMHLRLAIRTGRAPLRWWPARSSHPSEPARKRTGQRNPYGDFYAIALKPCFAYHSCEHVMRKPQMTLNSL